MDTVEQILNCIFLLAISVAIVSTPVVVGFNFHQKDVYRKELILNCNNDLACIKLIIGDTKYGY